VKVGDLVELSAYGKGLRCNRSVTGKVGLVVSIDLQEVASPAGAVSVAWAGHYVQDCFHIRRDLKHVR